MDAADPRAAGGDTEPCATCGAPMDSGQRYCLQCGARRAHLGGVREGLRMAAGEQGSGDWAGAGAAGASQAGAWSPTGVPSGGPGGAQAPGPRAQAGSGVTPPGGTSILPAPGAGASAFGDAPTRGSGATAIIAGVGVLLLSMGIGVLIGRTGSSSGKAAAAPQVISVASPGAATPGASASPGAATTTPTTSTPAHTAAPKPSKPAAGGVGSVPSKPAPPSALQNLRTGGSGQSYEQKSKALPNVVSTG